MNSIKQGTPEWFAIRCGKVTASRIADLTAKTKSGSGWGISRANYLSHLLAERLTGNIADSFSNAAMQWGEDNEPLARSAYEFYSDNTVTEIGFVDHPTIKMSGASPDGLIADDGVLEIKCPNTATHLDTLRGKSIPGKYMKQMQWQMACAGRNWCDFVSYDPRMPEHLRLSIRRVPADVQMIVDLEEAVTSFIIEINREISLLNQNHMEAAE